VAPSPPKEIRIERDECWSAQADKQRQNLFVLCAFGAQVRPNLADRNAPFLQKKPLAWLDIFIQDDQAGTFSRSLFSAAYFTPPF
jgi:hypothetical protein